MIWIVLILCTITIIPFLHEGLRKSVSTRQENTPGTLVKLSQGYTHYQWFGPETGPVLVCVHGLTTPSLVWGSLVKRLTWSGMRVLVYDLYGRGHSDRPKGLQNQAFFTQQLHELLDALKLTKPVTLAGYSMGGAIVPGFAAVHPDKVRRIILLAPAGMGHDLGWLCWISAKLPWAGDWLMRAFYPAFYHRDLAHDESTPDEVIKGQRQEPKYKGFTRSVLSSLRGVLSEDMATTHQTIAKSNIPTLAIWGRDDSVIPLSGQQKLARWNPAISQRVIDNSDHGLIYTHPNEIARIITAWLEDQ